MWIVSFRVNLAVMLVFLTPWPAYALIGLGVDDASATLTHIGGAFGIATAVIAWYVSLADTLHNTLGRALVPLVPFGDKVVDEPPQPISAYRSVGQPSGSPTPH